jgi:hypothetical protein
MKVNLCFVLLIFISTSLHAQYSLASFTGSVPAYGYSQQSFRLERPPYAKLRQRNYGAIIGIQRGKATSFEFGGEAHWRKMSLKKPHIIGATANLEYNFGNHVMGYKAGMWMKRGRVNLTYGANLVYFTDFEGNSRYGGGPSVGFRLLGLHLVNGLNILAGDKEMENVNTLYISLRYYFPIENKFTWDKKSEKKKEREKRQKAKAKEKKREEREKRREENPSILDRIKKPFEKS